MLKPVAASLTRLNPIPSRFAPVSAATTAAFPAPPTAGAATKKAPDSAAQRAAHLGLKACAAGGISLREYDTVARELMGRFSMRDAQSALAAATPEFLTKMDDDALAALRERCGAFGGHADRLEQVLADLYPGAILVDANMNGILDAQDVVLVPSADGSRRQIKLGDELCERAQIGAAVVTACEMMANAKHAFALLKDQRFSSALWEQRTPGSGVFRPKPGVSPAYALNDVFVHPRDYRFDCATAAVLVYYRAMLELLGATRFDQACEDLLIGPWAYEDDLDVSLEMSGEAADGSPTRLQVGDGGYFKNWEASSHALATGWAGENVIYLGQGKYYAHPFGITTEPVILKHLDAMRAPGATRRASRTATRWRLLNRVMTR